MDRQEMFQGKRWGLFNHFLCVPAGDGTGEPCSPEEWNARVDAFDVELLAAQLREVGADYFCITIGQNSGHYCSPNPVYDQLVGISPSKCSRRDLIADLAAALEPQGIDLWVYLPSGAPCADAQAVERLEWVGRPRAAPGLLPAEVGGRHPGVVPALGGARQGLVDRRLLLSRRHVQFPRRAQF